MRIIVLLVGFLAILIKNPLYACDIVNKKTVHMDGVIGVAGYCSNNGEKIECYDVGEYSGGLTCDGPEGTNSGYNLMNLIYAVCGCTPEDQENIEEQMEQELNK